MLINIFILPPCSLFPCSDYRYMAKRLDPDRWEPQIAGDTRRVYFLDHVNQCSTWSDPRMDPVPDDWEERKDDDGISIFVRLSDESTTFLDPRVGLEAATRSLQPAAEAGAKQQSKQHQQNAVGKSRVSAVAAGAAGGSTASKRSASGPILGDHGGAAAGAAGPSSSHSFSGPSSLRNTQSAPMFPQEPAPEPGGFNHRLVPKEEVAVHRERDWKADYVVDTRIGQGGFGKIILAHRKDAASSADKVVIKLLDVKGSKEKRNVAVREAFVHGRCGNHPNIVEFREAYLGKDSIAIVMEHCENNTLHDLIQMRLSGPRKELLPEAHIMFWFASAADGLHYLHRHGVVHRDIKPANLFLNANNSIRIGDFGMAVSNDKSEAQNKAGEFHGTPDFLAPEVLEGRPHTQKSDVWALGAVLYNLAALQPPFSVKNPLKQFGLLRDMVTTKKFPPLPEVFSADFRALVASMLQKKERFRPTLREVLSSDYLAPFVASVRARQESEMAERARRHLPHHGGAASSSAASSGSDAMRAMPARLDSRDDLLGLWEPVDFDAPEPGSAQNPILPPVL